MAELKCVICDATFPIELIERYSFELRNASEFVEVCPHICQNCGFVFLWPPPSPGLLARHYASQNRIPTQTAAYKDQADWIGAVDGRVLDIGCYDGRLLKELQKNGAEDLWGVEPDRNIAADGARWCSVEEIPVELWGTFDLITIMHTLEHVADPVAMLQHCHGLLRPNGQLVIEVPNLETPQIQIVPHWLPWHVNYFIPSVLYNLLRFFGFYWAASSDCRNLPYGSYRLRARCGTSRAINHLRARRGTGGAIADSVGVRRAALAVKLYQMHRRLFLEGVREKLRRLREPIAIFGTGEHTQFLMMECDILRPAYYIDSYRRGVYRGRPLLRVGDGGWLDAAHIILSSYDSQEEMASVIGKEGGAEKTVRLYDNPVAYDTWEG